MCGASCVRDQGCMPLSQLSNGCPVCCTQIYRETDRQWRDSAWLSCPTKDEFLFCLGKGMWSHSLKIQPMSLATHDLIRPSPLCKVLSRSPLLLLLSLTLWLCLYTFCRSVYQCVCVSRLHFLCYWGKRPCIMWESSKFNKKRLDSTLQLFENIIISIM